MIVPASTWAAQQVEKLPSRWQLKLLGAWKRQGGGVEPDYAGAWVAQQQRATAANVALVEVSAVLGAVRLNLDATDTDVCALADKQAERCAELSQVIHHPQGLRERMGVLCQGYGLLPAGFHLDKHGAAVMTRDKTGAPKMGDMPAIRRMIDPLWWRRGLRKAHAKSVEAAAISLGYVNRARDKYISAESFRRRQQQNRRNAEALENTIATNEHGQEYTLAELAATGPGNRAIRRAELMTRIAGFERIAVDMGHAGLFFTITCPSRMHKWATTAGGGVRENGKFDGTTPREAQAYLAKVWARIRAALARKGCGLYGFRIAEPNHDGCPHWHLLTFHAPEHLGTIRRIVRRYALADSPDERGADMHRVDFKPIDRSRGSAAGYIAKYVAKNVDGYGLQTDLAGDAFLDTAARVEAWAATWGIRQFQQVGGPPVTIWRELRRVESVPDNAPDHLKQAHAACNRVQVLEGRDNQSVDWSQYVKAQGGVFCGRRYRVRLAQIERDGETRYGEPLSDQTIGVKTLETYTPEHMRHMRHASAVRWLVVESKRFTWTIASRRKNAEAAKPLAPWTRVNNCTRGTRKAEPEAIADELNTAQRIEAAVNQGFHVPEVAGDHQAAADRKHFTNELAKKGASPGNPRGGAAENASRIHVAGAGA